MNKQETVDGIAAIIDDRIVCRRMVAAEIAGTIEAKHLLIDRAELPEVTEEPDRDYFMAGWIVVAVDSDPGTYRRMALNYLAAAEHLEQRDTEEAEREKQQEERRNELAREISRCGYDYLGAAPVLRTAIDRIIALEDGAP